jgi:hypothetical protein
MTDDLSHLPCRDYDAITFVLFTVDTMGVGVSDQDILAGIDECSTRHAQADQSLVALAEAIEVLIHAVKVSPGIDVLQATKLASALGTVATVKRNHGLTVDTTRI